MAISFIVLFQCFASLFCLICVLFFIILEQLKNFFKYVNKLEYTERPDYDQVKKWFRDALKKTEYPDDGKSVHFDAFAPGKKAAVGTTVKARSPGKSMKRVRIIYTINLCVYLSTMLFQSPYYSLHSLTAP